MTERPSINDDRLYAALAGFGMPVQGAAPQMPTPRPADAPRGIGGIDTEAAMEAAEPAETEPVPAPADNGWSRDTQARSSKTLDMVLVILGVPSWWVSSKNGGRVRPV